MIIAKHRTQSNLLKALTYLDRRIELLPSDKKDLNNLKKGYEGECLFDQMVSHYVDKEVIVLNDLLLISSGHSFQIDAMVITSDKVYVYEIKNYKGDYINRSEGFTTRKGIELSDPKVQLSRMKISLAALFQKWRVEKVIEANVVFVHPEFFLYQASVNDPIILPMQIPNHLIEINDKSNFLIQEDHRLAEMLIEAHQEEVPYQKQIPKYEFEQLKKGMHCISCGKDDLRISQRACYCLKCSGKVDLLELILSNIEEYRFLFPNEKLTTKHIFQWCGKEVTIQRIREILQKYFTACRKTNGQYYI